MPRSFVNPLSTIFGAVVQTRNTLYDRGILKSRRLRAPAISIGNISVGGSGKTPFVIMLGELLKARGIHFDVLSRGYGRRTRGAARVQANGSPAEFGDEPLLIAQRLGVPVIVGESRFEAGELGERTSVPQLHILDDGFQHRALHRDFDIVLLTADDANGKLLPTGHLREPLSSLQRADAVVLTGNAEAELSPLRDKFVWRLHRGVTMREVPPRPLVFCGIARPQYFISQLEELGIKPSGTVFFRDHHPYNAKDVQRILQAAERHKSAGFITTEKDAVNLGGVRNALQPLSVAQVTMELENAADAVDTILRAAAEHRSPGVRQS